MYNIHLVNSACLFSRSNSTFVNVPAVYKRRILGFLLTVFLIALNSAVIAAETDAENSAKVTVEVSGVEDDALNNVLGFLPLYEFHDKEAPSPARLRFLHRAADERIQAALQPFGYYKVQVEKTLKKDGQNWLASYNVSPGDAIRIQQLDIRLLGAGEKDPEFQKVLEESELKLGEPLNHAAYEALKKQFQVIASQRGYFDAQLIENRVGVNLKSYEAAVTLHFNTGDRYKLGSVTFNQDRPWLDNKFLDKYVDIEPNQPYDAADLQQLQGDLSNTEYYKQVELNAAREKALDLTIPVDVNLTAKNPRKYIFGVGYGTDTGARAKVGVTGRRVNRWGHNYTAEMLVSQIKYGVAGEYVIPGSDPRSDAYGIRASYEDEHSDNREYKAINLGGYYKYRENLWMKTWALDYRIEEFELGDETDTSRLLIPSIDWTRTYPAEMEKRVYASAGTWLQLRLRGGHDALLSDTSFLQPQVSAKWIHSFGNRSRIITRGSLATTWVDDWDKLPTSLRYYAGGDRSVRGYEYNVIAPREDGDVVGGKHLTEASIEYEYPIAEKWSIATFADVGDAFDEQADYKTGVGMGLHWVSPIGPVRIDIGHGLDDPPGNKIRLHLTIGPDL